MRRMFEAARRTIASLAQWAEESRMVGRELWEELHRARSVDGLSVSALARRIQRVESGVGVGLKTSHEAAQMLHQV